MPLATRRNGAIAAAAIVSVGLIVGLGVGLGTRKQAGSPAQPSGQPSTTLPSASRPLAAPVAAPGTLGVAPGVAVAAPSQAEAPSSVLVRAGHENDGMVADSPVPMDFPLAPAYYDAPAPRTATPEEALRAARASGADPRQQQEAAEKAAMAANDRTTGRPVQGAAAPGPATYDASAPSPGWVATALAAREGPAVNLDDPSLYGDVNAPNAQTFKGQPIDCVNQGATTFLSGGPCSNLADYYRPLAPQLGTGNQNVLRSLALGAPVPNAECCAELRTFIEHGCTCAPTVMANSPATGFSPRQVAIGAGIMQLSQCAAPSAGGPIFNPCTMTVGRMYRSSEAATTLEAASPATPEGEAAAAPLGGRRLLTA